MGLLIFLVGVVFIYVLWKVIKERRDAENMKKQIEKDGFVCTRCGEKTHKLIVKKRGSTIIEIILYFLVFIIGGLIYTAWRYKNKKVICPHCKGEDTLIPVNSKVGRSLTTENIV